MKLQYDNNIQIGNIANNINNLEINNNKSFNDLRIRITDLESDSILENDQNNQINNLTGRINNLTTNISNLINNFEDNINNLENKYNGLSNNYYSHIYNMFDDIFPIGSYYISSNSENP